MMEIVYNCQTLMGPQDELSDSMYMQIDEDEDFSHITQKTEEEIHQRSQARITHIQWKKRIL